MTHQEYLENAIEQLKQNPTNDCVLWPYTKNKQRQGYGQVTYNGKPGALVHRVAYKLYYGVGPTQMVLHKCGSHSCFNPLHLYDGSAQQNIQDVIDDKGYFPGGRRKLTERDVIQIIQMLTDGVKQDDIAAHFGVVRSTISYINTGRSWKHIPRNGKPPAKTRRSPKQAIILQYTGKPKTSKSDTKSRHYKVQKHRVLPDLPNDQIETAKQLHSLGLSYRELAHWFNVRPSELKELLNVA